MGILDCRCCCCRIPQRVVLTFIVFLGQITTYVMRLCLSITLVEMVKTKKHSLHHGGTSCPDNEVNSTATVNKDLGEYDWTEVQQQHILSSFFPTYVIAHLPGGVLSDLFGGKHVFGTAVLISSICTVVTPLAIQVGDWQLFVVTRLLIGLSQGVTIPAVTSLISRWAPPKERSLMASVMYSGNQVGSILSMCLSGLIIDEFRSWRIVFYFWGVVGIVWYVIFLIFCSSDPAQHHHISEEERYYITSQIPAKRKFSIPWKRMFKDIVLWALIFGQYGHALRVFTVLTELPKYMKDVLRFNIKENGFYSTIPYIAMWICTTFFGYLADCIIRRNCIKVVNVRRSFTTIAAVGPAVCLVLVGYAGCDKMIAVAMFAAAMGLTGAFFAGVKVNCIEISSNFSGTVMSIVNGIGAIAGYFSPMLIASLVEEHTIEEWQKVFWVVFGISIVCNIVYVIFTSSNKAEWDDPETLREIL